MLINKVVCELCGREFRAISHTHLMKEHDMTLREYMARFPEAPLYEKVVNEKPDGKELLLDALNNRWNK